MQTQADSAYVNMRTSKHNKSVKGQYHTRAHAHTQTSIARHDEWCGARAMGGARAMAGAMTGCRAAGGTSAWVAMASGLHHSPGSMGVSPRLGARRRAGDLHGDGIELPCTLRAGSTGEMGGGGSVRAGFCSAQSDTWNAGQVPLVSSRFIRLRRS